MAEIGDVALLMAELQQVREQNAHLTRALYLIGLVAPTILVDKGLITREEVVARLRELRSGMPQDRQEGLAGQLMDAAIQSFQRGGAPDLRSLLRVIEGGVSENSGPPDRKPD